MAGFIQNIIWNSVEGFVEAGTRTAGEYAGNALIKAGDMIENGGRGVGNSIERKATSYGSSISGQTYKPSPKALPSTARKPVVKRSNSMPANSKPTTSGTAKGMSQGASKYPGANQVNGARKALTGTVRSTVTGGSSKPFPSSNSNFKSPQGPTSHSKPLPKPYSGNAFGGESNKLKTAVKPGQPKPFTLPGDQKKVGATEKKPYPGTNTLPGQGSRVPVQKQRLKALPRMGPQVGQGQTMTHLPI